MRSQGILALVSTALVGSAMAQEIPASQIAPTVSNNPSHVVYKATLPDKPFFAQAALEGNVRGYLSGVGAPDGNGVKFTLKVENLPKVDQPFIWHIHVNPAVDGNCTSTGAHLDPYNRGETPPCDHTHPASCQTGDLSGKFGGITKDPFTLEFVDRYSSTQPGTPAFFGNRSFVIHYANKTRLTCANFAKLYNSESHGHNATTIPTGVSTVLPTGTGGPGKPSSTAPFNSGASLNTMSISLMGGAVAAMMLLL